jgi:hypothetical protein
LRLVNTPRSRLRSSPSLRMVCACGMEQRLLRMWTGGAANGRREPTRATVREPWISRPGSNASRGD